MSSYKVYKMHFMLDKDQKNNLNPEYNVKNILLGNSLKIKKKLLNTTEDAMKRFNLTNSNLLKNA